MISRAVTISGVLSVIVHVGAIAAMTGGQDIAIAGAVPAPARLGNSFQDIVAGSAVSAPVSTLKGPVPAVEAAVLAPILPSPATRLTRSLITDDVVSDATTLTAVIPLTLSGRTIPATIAPQNPLVPVAPVPTTQTITGVEPVNASAASAETTRPRPRPVPQEGVPAPRPQQQAGESVADRSAHAATAPGAAETERRGVSEGTETGVSDDAGGNTGTAKDAGNADASNYPGQVMRKINRTRKPHVGVQGTAIVGFEIASDGNLVGVHILQSSGESGIDQAALDHLRRAAPFPAPPSGAQRRFQVEYISRG